jgi:hypothetical protein
MHGWIADLEHGGICLSVNVRDSDGVPDPQFLSRVPRIISKLIDLEEVARRAVPEVTSANALDSILSPVRPDENYEFALGFSPRDENSYEMSIYVNFKGDQVVGWLGVD